MTNYELEFIQLLIVKARTDFLSFVLLVEPEMKINWFNIELAKSIQQFYNDLISNKKPKLIIQAPPQHGKTTFIKLAIAWINGRYYLNKDILRTIYTSFSEDLVIKANKDLQIIFSSDIYKLIFGDIFKNTSKIDLIKNSSLIEFSNKSYFKNTTVKGSITGQSLDFGVVDDPIKGREEANSITIMNEILVITYAI